MQQWRRGCLLLRLLMLYAFTRASLALVERYRGWKHYHQPTISPGNNMEKPPFHSSTSQSLPPKMMINHVIQRHFNLRAYPSLEASEEKTFIGLEELETKIVESPDLVRRETFHGIFRRILANTSPSQKDDVEVVNKLFQAMKGLPPKARPIRETYELVQQVWLKKQNEPSTKQKDPETWLNHLQNLWDMYNTTTDEFWLHVLAPSRSTYLLTFKGILQCDKCPSTVLDVTETLFYDMIRHAKTIPELNPDILCANQLLMIWNKFGGIERCEYFLSCLEKLYKTGRHPLLQPNRFTYNLVIDAIARSKKISAAECTEAILMSMMKVAGCEPDITTYNTVLNAWSRSKSPVAAERAGKIVATMQKRFKEGLSKHRPDLVTYNTLLNTLAKSPEGYKGARKLLDQMEQQSIQPDVISYNILIKALADDLSVTNATERALEILDAIRGVSDSKTIYCEHDSVTYGSVIKVISRESSKNAPQYAEKAIELLKELEADYDKSNDPTLVPSSIPYTLTISAIARSGTGPERANEILNRLEERFLAGRCKDRPDHICYNALLNAYGWSDSPGRSFKCFEVFLRMKELFQSKANVLAKPDIITCNSVLNACAHEDATSKEERLEILRCAVETYEFFRTNAPTFGRPDHVTFDRTLKVIAKHQDDESKRHAMAESIFAECCLRGQVSVLVVTTLHRILPWNRLSELLGGALLSRNDEPFRFCLQLLPAEYTIYAPRAKSKSFSRGSPNKLVQKSRFPSKGPTGSYAKRPNV